MKKYSVILYVVLLLLYVLPGCEKITGEGPVISETRQEPPFSGLSVSVAANVFFTFDTVCSIQLQAQQNILHEIETSVVNNILRIRFDPDVRIRNHEPITIHVTAPMATLLEIHGSGILEAEGLIDAAEMRLEVSGSGSIRAEEIQCNKIEARLSGSGKIIVDAGSANEENVHISGSGYIDLSEVTVKDAHTWISGSGTMRVYPANTLDVNISGSGTVFYRGNPDFINSQVSGSGSVVKM